MKHKESWLWRYVRPALPREWRDLIADVEVDLSRDDLWSEPFDPDRAARGYYTITMLFLYSHMVDEDVGSFDAWIQLNAGFVDRYGRDYDLVALKLGVEQQPLFPEEEATS